MVVCVVPAFEPVTDQRVSNFVVTAFYNQKVIKLKTDADNS